MVSIIFAILAIPVLILVTYLVFLLGRKSNKSGTKFTLMNKKGWSIIIYISSIVILSFVFYQQTHLSVWGFNLYKDDIKDLIVQIDNKPYVISDKETVLKIANELSTMKKHSKVEVYDSYALNRCLSI